MSARRDGPIAKAMRWVGRHKGATLIAMLALLLAGTCGVIMQLVLAQRRVDAAYERAQKIEAFQLAVSEQGQRFDDALDRFEKQVASLAGHVAELLDDANGANGANGGTGGYPADYDGRTRPKYTLAAGAVAGDTRIHWGNPFVDRYGHGLVLPVSTAVHLPDGSFAGVTGLELTAEWIAKHLLQMPGAPYVVATFLVDERGRVVIGTEAGGAAAHHSRAGDRDQDRAPELRDLEYPEVRAALADGQRSHVELVHDDRPQLVAISPLPALGWSYVVIADEDRLLAAP